MRSQNEFRKSVYIYKKLKHKTAAAQKAANNYTDGCGAQTQLH
jgi:hypothetical protein